MFQCWVCEGEKVKAQTSLYLFLHVLNLNLLSANEKKKAKL